MITKRLRKRKLVEELKKGRERERVCEIDRGKQKQLPPETHNPVKKKESVKKRKVTLGWMHYPTKGNGL